MEKVLKTVGVIQFLGSSLPDNSRRGRPLRGSFVGEVGAVGKAIEADEEFLNMNGWKNAKK